MQLILEQPFKPSNDAAKTALLLAAVVHGLLILGLGFASQAGGKKQHSSFQVTLLNGPESKAADTEITAVIEQQGSGNSRDKRDNQQAIPGQFQESVPVQLANPAPQVAEALASSQGQFRVVLPGTLDKQQGRSSKRVLDALLPPLGLMSIAGEDELTKLFGPKRALRLHPAAKQGVAVEYKEAWRRWMNSNGNLYYPQEARRLGLKGDVLTEIGLSQRGELVHVKILQSSGQRLLDEAVLQTTRETRWFKPFPAELADKTNILIFAYRWRYGV